MLLYGRQMFSENQKTTKSKFKNIKYITRIGKLKQFLLLLQEVLDWYLQAVRRTNSKQGKHDQDIEPIYIFCSYLVKYFHQGKLEAIDVHELLASERALHNVQPMEDGTEQEVVFLGSSTDNSIAEKSSLLLQELKPQTCHLPLETARAYNAVFLRLSEMRITDNKSWQHRTIYRVSKIVAIFITIIFNIQYFHLDCLDVPSRLSQYRKGKI